MLQRAIFSNKQIYIPKRSKMLLIYLVFDLMAICLGSGDIKEERYVIAPGVEGYHLSIPVNHSELDSYLTGKKTQMLQDYEKEHGFDESVNVFGDLAENIIDGTYDFSDTSPRPIKDKQVFPNDTEVFNVFNPRNDTQRSEALEAGHALVKRQAEKSEAENVLFLDEVIKCKPYKRLYASAVLSNDHEAEFEPACLEVALCDGCCGYKTCMPTRKKRIGYFYHKWETEEGAIAPQLNVHTFQFYVHETCMFRCKEERKDCSSKQVFDAEKCQCKCPVVDRCGKHHNWHDKECKCLCKRVIRCRRDETFSNADCRCHYNHIYDKPPPASTILPVWPVGGPGNPIDPADVLAGRTDIPYDHYD